jgi:hypothetical protein
MADAIVLGNARVLKPGKLRWLRALAWLVVLTLLVALAFNLVAEGTLRAEVWASGSQFTTRSAAPLMLRMIAVMIGAFAAVIAYWGAVRVGEDRRVVELAGRPLVPEALAGTLLGGALMAVTVAAMWAGGWVTVTAAHVTDVFHALQQTAQSAIVEEIMFRLVIFRLLWRAFGVWPALILSAVLFGALHLANPDASWFAAFCLIAGEGVGLGLYLLTGRAWMSIGAHAGWNFTQGWLLGAAVSGNSGFGGGPFATQPVPGVAPFLSGGGFGPEASLAGLLVSLAASIAVLGLAWRRGRFVAGPEAENSQATS